MLVAPLSDPVPSHTSPINLATAYDLGRDMNTGLATIASLHLLVKTKAAMCCYIPFPLNTADGPTYDEQDDKNIEDQR